MLHVKYFHREEHHFSALHLDPLLLLHVSFVCLGFVAFASIFLIFTDALNVVLVVIAPDQETTRVI